MCSKDLDEQYTPDIVFLICTALFFILMCLLQMHYICFILCGASDQNSLESFCCDAILIEMSTDCYASQ